MTYSSLKFDLDLRAYRYMWQRIDDIKMWKIALVQLCLIYLYTDRIGVLVDGVPHSVPLINVFVSPYGRMLLRAISLFRWGWWGKREHTGNTFLLVNETNNPHHFHTLCSLAWNHPPFFIQRWNFKSSSYEPLHPPLPTCRTCDEW